MIEMLMEMKDFLEWLKKEGEIIEEHFENTPEEHLKVQTYFAGNSLRGIEKNAVASAAFTKNVINTVNHFKDTYDMDVILEALNNFLNKELFENYQEGTHNIRIKLESEK